MNTRNNANYAGPSERSDASDCAGASDGPPGEGNMDMMRLLLGMMKEQKNQRVTQHEQITLLRDGLLAAQQAATAAVDKVVAPKEPKVGNISDFRRLNPKTFTGNETPL